MTLKLIVTADSSSEDYNADIDSVFVEIDKSLAQRIMERRKLFLHAKAADKDTYEMYFWGGQAVFLQNFSCSDEWSEVDGFPESVDEAETECDQMIIRESGVSWTAMPRHSGIYVTTREIDFEKIETLL